MSVTTEPEPLKKEKKSDKISRLCVTIFIVLKFNTINN